VPGWLPEPPPLDARGVDEADACGAGAGAEELAGDEPLLAEPGDAAAVAPFSCWVLCAVGCGCGPRCLPTYAVCCWAGVEDPAIDTTGGAAAGIAAVAPADVAAGAVNGAKPNMPAPTPVPTIAAAVSAAAPVWFLAAARIRWVSPGAATAAARGGSWTARRGAPRRTACRPGAGGRGCSAQGGPAA
jgi:hypothetical protein